MNTRFLYQWHITDRCNLRCTHCYQSDYACDTPIEDIKLVMRQLDAFTKHFAAKAHINLTGGEPLACRNFFETLDMIRAADMTVGVLTNGTLITKEMAKRLASYKNLTYIQISIDGPREIHDKVRGEGNFDRAVAGAAMIRKYSNIPVYASFTAHRENFRELRSAINACRKARFDYFWTDRVIPFGQSEKENCMSSEQFEEFLSVLSEEARKNGRPFNPTFVKTQRALQFMCGTSDMVYHCEAGDTFFTIDEKCRLLACRRMPIEIGNLKEDDLLTLYLDSPIMQKLRRHDIPDDCAKCKHAPKCRGGLKCLAYAFNGDFNTKDPTCMA